MNPTGPAEWPKRFSWMAGRLTVLTGAAVLVGWALDIVFLKRVFSGLPPMLPQTAIAFVLAGGALCLLEVEPGGTLRKRTAQAAAWTVALLGAITICGYIFRWPSGLDRLFFKDSLPALQPPSSGRASMITGIGFLSCGLGLALLDTKPRAGRWPVDIAIVIPIQIALLALIGYACNVPSFYGWRTLQPNTAMSLHTAVAFTVLGIGLLCARPQWGLMNVIASPSAGGVVARRLLLAPVLIPLLTGLIGLSFRGTRAYNAEIFGWVFSFLNIFIFTLLIWWNASLLHEADEKHRRAEEALREAKEQLETRVRERTADLARANEVLRTNEARMAAQKAELQLILDSVPALIFYKDQEGRLVRVNSELARLMGRRRDEIEGKTDFELGSPYAEEYRAEDRKIMATGQQVNKSVELLHTALGPRWIETDKMPHRDEQGAICGIVGFALDITERKKAEQEIHQLNAELERRVGERTSQLVAANEELEAFSYSVSHDLRAPLRAMDGFSQAVVEDFGPQLPEEARRYLQTIRSGAQRMGALIDDLLTFSRLSRTPLAKQIVDTEKLVRDILKDFDGQRAERQVEVRAGELPPSEGDPALLRQVWVNLLSNAFKYTHKRPAALIEIGCLASPGIHVYFVRDNGAGFDMRYAGKLFGVFQRLHRSEDYQGTGVGLAIVQRVVRRHGGRAWAEAAVDRGATFYFTLEGEAEP